MSTWFLLSMMKKARCVVIMALLLSLTVSGCAAPKAKMYPGVEVAADRQAVIRVDERPEGGGTLAIQEVDRKFTVNVLEFLFTGGRWAGEVYVLPGKRILKVRMNYWTTYWIADLWIVAEPGETYVLRGVLPNNLKVRMWLENQRTGKTVGGIVGSDDEPKI